MIKGLKSYIMPLFVAGLYCLLYIPIFVLVIFSFNHNAITYSWMGFTTEWYIDLFNSVEVWEALCNSLFVALISVFLSLTLGSILIFFGNRRRIQRLLMLFYGSLAIPEIVL